jgi:hypothetical protein
LLAKRIGKLNELRYFITHPKDAEEPAGTVIPSHILPH